LSMGSGSWPQGPAALVFIPKGVYF
jgi:hypothetical protein